MKNRKANLSKLSREMGISYRTLYESLGDKSRKGEFFWKSRRVRRMKKFDVLKAITDEEKFSDMVFNLIEVKKTPEALAELLKEEMPEKELPHLKEAALNGYPLFFSGIQ